MKALKYIGISIVILLLIFVGFGYMQDKEVSVSRSVVVNAPMEVVFDQFNNLEKRLLWSPWEAQDSTMKPKLGEITKGVGASYSWNSKESGAGKIKYSEVVENQLIQSELYFGTEDEDPGQGLMIFSQEEDGVKVTWEVHMNMGNNPFMRLMGRYIDEVVGPTFESGLQSMKEISEAEKDSQPDYSAIEITETTVESIPCISILDSSSMDEMSQKIGTDYALLGAFLGKNGVSINGYSRMVYHKWEPPTKIVFEPQFVVDQTLDIQDPNVITGTTYGGKVITATHIGSYESSGIVWEALDAYILANNFEASSDPWEEYVNSPENEPDPNKLITNIYMPIK